MLALVTLVLGLAAAPGCYPPPLQAPVLDPYRAPACAWCPGNRGIEYGPRPATPVRSIAAGSVTFDGVVAGVRYVTVLGDDGVRVSYGRLASSSVERGQRIRVGQVVGATTERFSLSLRDGDAYVDPAPHLGEVRGRPRLVPGDGAPARPAPPGRLVCRSGATTGARDEVRRAAGR